MQKIAERPDFVVMFLPNESFLAMAPEKEPMFMEEALKRKVLVATPGTLIGLLKVVQFSWNEQKIAQNAQRIADEGSKLNGEIVKFLADFAKLSLALEAGEWLCNLILDSVFASPESFVYRIVCSASIQMDAACYPLRTYSES